MKKLYYLIILTVILGLVLTGCLLSNVGQVPTTEQSKLDGIIKANGQYIEPVTLWAGQNIDVGTVTVLKDGNDLTVIYNTTGDWVLTETHLAVADLLEEIPQTKTGNPKPGKFPYSEEHDPAVTTYTYKVPLADLDALLYIAAHASLLNLELVETVTVNAIESTPTDSNVPLESDKNYLLKASGTAIANPISDIVFDAKYSSTDGRTWLDTVETLDDPDILNLSVDGVFVDWGAYNPDHVYYWDMTGKDSLVALLIDDTRYDNNSGFLTVDIYLYQEETEETAWAAGFDFPGNNWAMYFNYTIPQIPQCWSLAGEWVITAYVDDWGSGKAYIHIMTITDNSFIGEDSFEGGTGVITGTVTGDEVVWNNNYDESVYYADIIGTIAGDGTMSGTWTDNTGLSGDWKSTAGAAKPIYCN